MIPAGGSRDPGLELVRARVLSVDGDDGSCLTRDVLGKERRVLYSLRPKAVGRPAAGETWLLRRVERTTWALDAMVDAPEPPSVAGSMAGASAGVVALLSALDGIGVIQDDTDVADADPINYPNAANYDAQLGSTLNTATTSYGDWTSAAATIVKQSAATKLLVRLLATGFVVTNPSTVTLGVNVSGTDYDMHAVLFSAVNARSPFLAEKPISGVAAGSQTVQVRCKVSTSSSTFRRDANDHISLTVMEVA